MKYTKRQLEIIKSIEDFVRDTPGVDLHFLTIESFTLSTTLFRSKSPVLKVDRLRRFLESRRGENNGGRSFYTIDATQKDIDSMLQIMDRESIDDPVARECLIDLKEKMKRVEDYISTFVDEYKHDNSIEYFARPSVNHVGNCYF